MKYGFIGVTLAVFAAAAVQSASSQSDRAFQAPANYREWVYLSSGLDMNYTEAPRVTDRGNFFTNVFVNPEAYRGFMASGSWPDNTTFVLEIRRSSGVGSINKGGKYQTATVGLEYHVKENGVWTFYAPRAGNPVAKIPTSADCYSCHDQHGAVDSTFVQFYPTLLEVAKAKGTLAAHYLKSEAEKTSPPAPERAR